MLPEDASLEDIQYPIYVRQKIQQGLEDVEAGRVLSHSEVQQRLAKWLTKIEWTDSALPEAIE